MPSQIRLNSNTDSIGFSINPVGADFEITAVKPGSIAALLNFRVGDRVSSLDYLVQVGGGASKTLLDSCAEKYSDKDQPAPQTGSSTECIDPAQVMQAQPTIPGSPLPQLRGGEGYQVDSSQWPLVPGKQQIASFQIWPGDRPSQSPLFGESDFTFNYVTNLHTFGHLTHKMPYLQTNPGSLLIQNPYLHTFEQLTGDMPDLQEKLVSLVQVLQRSGYSDQDMCTAGESLFKLLQELKVNGYSEQNLVQAVQLLMRLLSDQPESTTDIRTNFVNILGTIGVVSRTLFSSQLDQALNTFLENSDLLIHLQRNGGLNPESLVRLLRATRSMMILVGNDKEPTKLSKLLPTILLLQIKYPRETAKALAIKIELYCKLRSLLVAAKQSLVEANESLIDLDPKLYSKLETRINPPLQKADFFVPHLFDPFHYDQDITQAEHRSVWVSDLATLNTTISKLVSKMPTQSSRSDSELNLIRSKWIDFNKKVSQAISIIQNRGSSVQQLTY